MASRPSTLVQPQRVLLSRHRCPLVLWTTTSLTAHTYKLLSTQTVSLLMGALIHVHMPGYVEHSLTLAGGSDNQLYNFR